MKKALAFVLLLPVCAFANRPEVCAKAKGSSLQEIISFCGPPDNIQERVVNLYGGPFTEYTYIHPPRREENIYFRGGVEVVSEQKLIGSAPTE